MDTVSRKKKRLGQEIKSYLEKLKAAHEIN